jgi:hypothetical protein
MNKVERVKELYNNGQDEYEIKKIYKNIHGEYKVVIRKISKNAIVKRWEWEREKDFYEWLINPKYKVFEIFPKASKGILVRLESTFHVNNVWKNWFKQPEKILTYLADRRRQ